ncbi:MAG: FAD-dependent oxidoreductase [bacterium]|nr:FAD-dependent oxidoreductase [bacterium]
MQKRKAIILGAGPVGLVTAWQLLENGWTVDIYERQNAVGGMCRTWKWNEFFVDTGPHIYHTPDPQLATFWEKEFGDLMIKGEFWCKNVKGEKFDEYYDYPLSWESISRYPKELKAKILDELDHLDPEKKAHARNFKEYVEAQAGPTLRKMFFEKYPQKIWGISTEEMTPDWAPKRVEFRQKVTPFYYNQWNAVGKYGTGCIYERIREKILKLGGGVHLGSTVIGIEAQENQITAVKFLDGKTVAIGSQDVIISSLPITLTGRLLGYQSSLQFRGIHSVYLAYNKESILPEGIHWLYYDSEKVYFNRVTEGKKLSPYVAPKGKTFLTAEITFSKGDAIDSMDATQLMQEVARQVELVGLAKASEVTEMSHNVEPFVYPLQFTGYREELAKIRAVISSFGQLYSIGTGGDFNYADSQILFHKAFDTVAVLCGKDSSYTQVVRQTAPCALNRFVDLGNRRIGEGEKPYIIAEAGINHNGSVQMAKELIDAAIRVGADAVKFQTFKASSRISKKVKAVKYAETITGLEETIYDMFDRLAMSFEDQKELFTYARGKGIEIFSTPFDFESVDFLESMQVKLYKIASMDLVNIPLIKYVAKTRKPMIISTGMSTLGQVEEAVNAVAQAGNQNLILLHCNSSYPAAPAEMNLNAIKTLRQAFHVPIGFSDHTFGLVASQTALAIGANVIERHFTLDRTLEGPDHILSSEPHEFAQLIEMTKRIPQLLGNGIKIIQPNEYATLNMQRKSLYAAKDIEKGQIITEDAIAIKGPGGGLLPKYFDIVVGRIARERIEEDFPITWENV